jgi:chaperonin GroEL
MDDIATLTGATVISDLNGLKMENIELIHLGSAGKIIVSEHKTTIIKGGGTKDKVEQHKKEIKVQLDEMKDEGLKEVWRKRLASISGTIGIIKVGGATDVEVSEKRDRVDDACRAVKSAIEEGIVVGGGVALIRSLKGVGFVNYSGDEKIGRDIVMKACLAPLTKMLENAELNLDIIEDIITLQPDSNGFNVKTNKFENLFETGVIDPTKVVRCALQNAASVAGAIITSGCLCVEMKQK